jgi:hypothetical protein
MAMKEIGPVDHTLPGNPPICWSFAVSTEVSRSSCWQHRRDAAAMAGLFANFSSRLSPAAAGSSLIVICTIAFSAALLLIAATAIAISIGRAHHSLKRAGPSEQK